MTEQERRLWYAFLKNLPLKIYRQKPIGEYIIDFYCHQAKLVIELDGSQHYNESGQAYDRARTARLEMLGLRVLRFTNLDVNTHFKDVCDTIEHELGLDGGNLSALSRRLP